MDAVIADIVAAQWGKLGPAFEPADVYAFTRAGIADCLENGVTTVFDWCHVINSPEHAEAAVAAHKSLGMRAVFGYGGSMDNKLRQIGGEDVASSWNHASALRDSEFRSDDARLTMALALPGLDYSTPEVTVDDVAAARDLGLPMSFHVGIPEGDPPSEAIRGMAEAGLLGADMSFSHCCTTTDDEMDLAASHGARLMTCPVVDASTGMGSSPTRRMRQRGLRPCFTADAVVATTGDMFEEARVGLLLDRYEDSLSLFRQGESVKTGAGRMTAHQALEAVTSVAAGCCWLGDRVGTLTPGKQADVIMLRATDLNLWPASNLESAVLSSAHGSNVDRVFVAGEIVKRDGVLIGADLNGIRRDLVQARDRLYAAGGFDDVNPKA